VLKSLKLDVDDLRARNPTLIYARGNGLGFRGPEAEKAGYDAGAVWARGGFAHLLTPAEASIPIRSRPALGDHASAVSLAMGIAGALFKRERTGEPTVVETSLLSNAVWILSSDLVVSQVMENYEAHVRGQQEKRFPLMRPYSTSDGRWIQLMLLAPDKFWPELCALIDMPEARDDPRFATSDARLIHGDALIDIIADKIGRRPWDEWQPLFDAWNAPWELIQTIGEVADDVQVQQNGQLFDLQVTDGSKVRVVAGPVSFDGMASPEVPCASPGLGADTDAVLAAIGYAPAELARLREAAVIG
jgi:crotonobetainyl-CoA:carnitine CoA-transferase CaiB-like acyl-CoA transferase